MMQTIEMPEKGTELPREPWTVMRAISRHRRLLFLLGVLALLSGALVGREVARDPYRAEAVLLYSPLVRDEVGGAPIPQLESRKHMLKLQPLLQEVIKRRKLQLSTARLATACNVVVEPDSNVMTVGVEWPQPEAAADIANTVADVFLEQQSRVRRGSMRRTIDELERQQRIAMTAMGEAADSMRRFRQRHNVVNVDDEIRAGITELVTLQSQLHQARIDEQDATLKRKNLDSVLKTVAQKLPTGASVLPEDRTEQSSRLQYLRTSLEDDRTARERQVNLDRAEMEMSRSQRLVARGLLPPVEADRAVAQYQNAKLYVQDTPKMKAWRDQIATLERSVYGAPAARAPQGGLGAEVAVRTFQIELDNVGLADKVKYLTTAVARMQARLAGFPAIQRELVDLQERTARYDRELTALEAPLAQARRVHASDASDFVLLSRAVPPGTPARRRQLLTGLGLGLAFMLMGLGIVTVRELSVGTIRSSRELAHFTALPVWARLPRGVDRAPHALSGPLGDLGARMFRLSRSLRERGAGATRVLIAGPASPEGKQRVLDALLAQYVSTETRVASISLADTRATPEAPRAELAAADLAPDVAPQLRGGERTRELLRAAAERSDVVVVTCDALVDAAELLTLAVQCDVLLLVAQAGTTTRDEVIRLARQLRNGGVENGAWLLQDVSADFLDIEPDEA